MISINSKLFAICESSDDNSNVVELDTVYIDGSLTINSNTSSLLSKGDLCFIDTTIARINNNNGFNFILGYQLFQYIGLIIGIWLERKDHVTLVGILLGSFIKNFEDSFVIRDVVCNRDKSFRFV